MFNSFNTPIIYNLNIQQSKQVNNNRKNFINMCLVNLYIFIPTQTG